MAVSNSSPLFSENLNTAQIGRAECRYHMFMSTYTIPSWQKVPWQNLLQRPIQLNYESDPWNSAEEQRQPVNSRGPAGT